MKIKPLVIDKVRLVRRLYYLLTNQSRFPEKLSKVQEKNPKCFSRALFNFSIDYELYWGNAYKNGHAMTKEERILHAYRARSNSVLFFALLEELNMPCTWSIVAKLLSPNLTPTKEFKPAWITESWYQIPNTDITAYEAKEFIKLISKSPLQEIISHGFAHIDFADPCTSKEIAHEDLELARELLRPYTDSDKAFFYPCNKINHEDVSYNLGYRITRGQTNKWQIDKNQIIKTPEGFWMSPGMMSLKEAKKLVDIGVKNNSFIHCWMHLFELNPHADDLDKFYRPLFLYVKDQAAAGNLEIISFGGLEKAIAAQSSD